METSIYSHNLLDSINKLTNLNQSSDFENTLSYLTQRESQKEQELHRLINKYLRLTVKSSNRLQEYRQRIQRVIFDLLEVYESKIEIYHAQVDNNSQILLILEQWELKKDKLINKIQSINTDNEFGIKYTRLVDESNENLDKISRLRLELINLENKQSLLNNELLDTKNIIESKLFKFNESYNQIEEYQAFTLNKLGYQIPSSSGSGIVSPHSDDQNPNYYIPTSNISNKTSLKINPKFLVNQLTPKVNTRSIIESIVLQNDAIEDLIANQTSLASHLNSFQIVIDYAFEIVSKMEDDLFSNIQDSSAVNKETKMIKILRDTVDLLYTKFVELQNSTITSANNDMWSLTIDSLLHTEITTIEKSLLLLDSNYGALELPDLRSLSLSISAPTSISPSPSPSQSHSLSTSPSPSRSHSNSNSMSTGHTLKLKTPSPTPTLPKLSQASVFASISKTSNSPTRSGANTTVSISSQLLGSAQEPIIVNNNNNNNNNSGGGGSSSNNNNNSNNSITVTTPANVTAAGISKPTSSFKKYIDVNNGLVKNKGAKKD